MYIITVLSLLYHTSEYEVRKEINTLLSPRYTLGMSYTIFSQLINCTLQKYILRTTYFYISHRSISYNKYILLQYNARCLIDQYYQKQQLLQLARYIITVLSPLYHTSEYEVRKEINILLSPRYTLGMSYTIFSHSVHTDYTQKYGILIFKYTCKCQVRLGQVDYLLDRLAS